MLEEPPVLEVAPWVLLSMLTLPPQLSVHETAAAKARANNPICEQPVNSILPWPQQRNQRTIESQYSPIWHQRTHPDILHAISPISFL
jgi:hypothetical protein